ncbi:MAG: hypothetical protein A2Y62_09010 [Candidatus Fischerbacteria bacterium RBG_13_37_8]|uniref:Diguanylate cyclase n=1 Tax=Candidatus Fischerbacteria bacterium RBG_13_37_8 TaxID=1817863 RepID=A0A1F5VUJ2_9BACT|nr:MAG: hypothetical protein A2Y62_09010 [Candidatus Fischerbacteria bacterium RBG_13_37_8]
MKKKILIIDDEVKIAELIKLFLEQEGYRAVIAYNGLMGYQLISEENPDLILADMLLPGIPGLELCRKVKFSTEFRHIPVILMTAVYKKLTYQLEARKYGANDFLEKPFELPQLLEKIQKFLPPTVDAEITPEEILEQKLLEIGKDYLAGLPAKIEQLNALKENLMPETYQEDSLRSAHAIAHSLAGSSATFGFEKLSQLAGPLNDLLDSILQSGAPPSPDQNAQIITLLNNITQTSENYLQNLSEYTQKQIDTEQSTRTQRKIISAAQKHEQVLPKTIYLMSKDEDLIHYLSIQLEHYAFKVIHFEDCETLKNKLKEQIPEAIIMDMDSVKSAEACEEITKLLPSHPEKKNPCIALSSTGDISTRLSAIKTGAVAFFLKPVNAGDIIDKLNALAAPLSRQEPYRVLIIEDETIVSSYYQSILQEAGMIIKTTDEPLKIIEILAEHSPDLILMDLYMPDINGFELASVVRQHEEYTSIPIVFLSVEKNLEKQLTALNYGGDDFLVKPVQPRHLVSTIISRIQRSHAVRALIIKDSLSGLLNHITLREHLHLEVKRAAREKDILSFAMIDIDNFKTVNDTHGHLAGDLILKSLANLLKRRVRETDILGRYGGDEYAVIFPKTEGRMAAEIIDLIRHDFADMLHRFNNAEIYVTFSCGVASLISGMDAIKLNEEADKALYKAKQNGKNQTVLL